MHDIHDLIACPNCRRALHVDTSWVVCRECGSRFPCDEGIVAFAMEDEEFRAAISRDPLTAGITEDSCKDPDVIRERSRRRPLLNLYWKLQRRFIPSVQSSQSIYEEVLFSHVNRDMCWLDIGCGHHILPPWRLAEERVLVGNCGAVAGIDYSLVSLRKHKTIRNRMQGNIGKLPFKDRSFDLATANMVVEHLDDPEPQFREISRILKSGGHFIFHTPNIWGYKAAGSRLIPESIKERLIYLLEGRHSDDVFATHYRANSPSRIRKLAAASGFAVVQMKLLVSFAEFMMVPPLAAVELVALRLFMTDSLRIFRPYIIAVLKKEDD